MLKIEKVQLIANQVCLMELNKEWMTLLPRLNVHGIPTTSEAIGRAVTWHTETVRSKC